jgi:hypothetical protein
MKSFLKKDNFKQMGQLTAQLGQTYSIRLCPVALGQGSSNIHKFTNTYSYVNQILK